MPKTTLTRCIRLAYMTFADVQHFDQQGKSHRKVNVAFFNVFTQSFRHQHDADEQQEGQRQHMDRGVAVDEGGDGRGKEHHDHHRENDCRRAASVSVGSRAKRSPLPNLVGAASWGRGVAVGS